jgi:hypothetical protein
MVWIQLWKWSGEVKIIQGMRPLVQPIRIAPVGTAPAGTPAASAASSATFIVNWRIGVAYWRIGVVVVCCVLKRCG